MRVPTILFGLALCVLCPGCLYTTDVNRGWGLFANSFRNLGESAVYGADEVVIANRNRQLARDAWNEVRKTCPSPPSCDYANGFQEGFADFLDAGGTGEPPAVPPYRYRLSDHHTPEGHRAIQDWFAGFRAGSAQARQSGLRDVFVVPISDLPIRNERPYLPAGLNAQPGTQTVPQAMLRAPNELPRALPMPGIDAPPELPRPRVAPPAQ